MSMFTTSSGFRVDLPAGMPLNVPTEAVNTQTQTAANPSPTGKPSSPPTVVLFSKPQTPFPTVIQGLNFSQLSGYLTAYDMGLYPYVVRIWNLMRKRDSHLLSVSSKRFKRVSRLDYEITPMDSSPTALRQAMFLADFYADIKNFKKIVRHLMTATANGYAGTEVVWLPAAGIGKFKKPNPTPAATADPGKTSTPPNDPSEPPTESPLQAVDEFEYYQALRVQLVKVRADYFDESGGTMMVYPSPFSAQGMEIPADKFIIHRVDDALMIAGSILFVMKQISLGQWNQFCERFGMPGLIGTAPAGASEASRDTLQKIVESWAATMAAVLPPGYDIKTVAAAVSGSMLPAHILTDWCDEAQSVLWAGGNLTTKSQSGSGTLAGGAQQDQEIELAQDDAQDLAETIDESLSAPAVRFQFGEPLMCKFTFKVAKAVDLAASIEVDSALVNGLNLDYAEADIRAKYGVRKPDPGEVVIKARPAPTPVQLPNITGINKQLSGTDGTALKALHGIDTPSTVTTEVNTIIDQHQDAGRTALKQVFEQLAGIVNDPKVTSAEELEGRLKAAAGKISSERLQTAFEELLVASFTSGAKSVQRDVAAVAGGEGSK